MTDWREAIHQAGGLQRWPDGRPVVVDSTLTPDDFREGE